MKNKLCATLLMLALLCITCEICCAKKAQEVDLGHFTITYYDNCSLCCGKNPGHPAYGVTASGKKAQYGHVACNWLPFGTTVKIKGLGVFTVEDRGARSLFGHKGKRIKRIDVWVDNHSLARKLGKEVRRVSIVSPSNT